MLKKIKHIVDGFVSNGFLCVSSGFFSLLYAVKKYPNSNLIISELSFEGVVHYYQSGQMTTQRGSVDAYLFRFLNKKIKDRIFIFNKEIFKKLNAKNLDKEELIFN